MTSEEVTAGLRLESGTRVIRLECLRLQGEEVMVYCLDYIPRTIIPGRLHDIEWGGSLFDLLEDHGMRRACQQLLPPRSCSGSMSASETICMISARLS
nr:UTRA domain-containing protein [Microvirga pakistanensis]